MSPNTNTTSTTSSKPEPYKISVPQSALDRLSQKLALTELPTETPNLSKSDPWSRGSPLSSVTSLLDHWRTSYSWRTSEAHLNNLPQYTIPISITKYGTFNLHFAHAPSSRPDAIPLLFIHGWPGSFIEVSKILPLLTSPTSPDQPAFHVVAPSLINFGFSDGCADQGFGLDQHAEALQKLMLTLGYERYVTQGGDIGYFVSRFLSQMYPESCRATHVNMALPYETTLKENPELYARSQNTSLSDFEKKGMERTQWFMKEGSGYMRVHATKPQTLSYSLRDSPVGLLAWIYEKLHDWSDDYPWTPDEILTWISIYYFSTAGPEASLRIYYEMEHRKPLSGGEQASQYTEGPLIGIVRYPKELVQFPKIWHESLGRVVRWREFDSGGHFPAWERPEELVNDVREMFGKGGEAEGVVDGKSGYE